MASRRSEALHLPPAGEDDSRTESQDGNKKGHEEVHELKEEASQEEATRQPSRSSAAGFEEEEEEESSDEADDETDEPGEPQIIVVKSAVERNVRKLLSKYRQGNQKLRRELTALRTDAKLLLGLLPTAVDREEPAPVRPNGAAEKGEKNARKQGPPAARLDAEVKDGLLQMLALEKEVQQDDRNFALMAEKVTSTDNEKVFKGILGGKVESLTSEQTEGMIEHMLSLEPGITRQETEA